MLDVTVYIVPGDFFVAQANVLNVSVLLEVWILDIKHYGHNVAYFYVLKYSIEILFFHAVIVDAVIPEDGLFQRASHC